MSLLRQSQYTSPSWLTRKSWLDQAQACTWSRWHRALELIASGNSPFFAEGPRAEAPLEVPPTSPQPAPPIPTKALGPTKAIKLVPEQAMSAAR